MNVQPINNNVFIKPLDEVNKTESGIILTTEAYKSKLAKGELLKGLVIASGPGRLSKKGVRIPNDFAVGDTIIYRNHDLQKVKYNEEEILVMSSNFIMGVIESSE